MQQIVCIVAMQRAGTTALRDALASTGGILDCGEIFHTHIQARNKPTSFFGFARSNGLKFTDMITEDNAAKVCDEYLAHLKSLAKDRHILIDVKFNSWSVICPGWHFVHQSPYFLEFLKKLPSKFILLLRDNIADQILSEQIAHSARKWHNLTSADVAPITVDIERLKVKARLICLSECFFLENVPVPHRKVFKYETLFLNDTVNEQAWPEICDLIGEKISFDPRYAIRKNQVDKRLAIENYDEAVASLAEVAMQIRDDNYGKLT